MKIRALSLSPQRLMEIKQRYNIREPLALSQNFLFELKDLSANQLTLLKKNKNLFNIYETGDKYTLLISLKDNIDVQNIPTNPALQSIVNRIKTFYSGQSRPVWRFEKDTLDFNKGPFVMGILNVTPDSFYDGSRYNSIDKAVERALKMAAEGAKIIDVGGESTRPGAEAVPLEEELARVVPVIKAIAGQSKTLISVDTYKSTVARAALDAGADMVNDISGGGFDEKMLPLVEEYQCPYIIMHIKGSPKNMQQDPFYDDTLEEIYAYFENRLEALQRHGLQKVMIDPGIGFGKRLQDNLRLIRDLQDFTFLGYPILVGASRKSMIGQVLNVEKEERLYGSLAVHLQAALNGADVIRAHDVKATFETLRMSKAVDLGDKP